MPSSLSATQAMAVGTAGYTAMLAMIALEKHGITPSAGEILVTGASGGVGSVATTLMARAGFRVVASTGREAEHAYLKMLGATDIIDRDELSKAGKPLQRERWAGVIDSVGSHTLANACAATKADGAIAACGMAQGLDLPASVAPFILRGVTLYGINSVTRPKAERVEAWRRIADCINGLHLEQVSRVISLVDAPAMAATLIEGKVRGRVVVDVNGD